MKYCIGILVLSAWWITNGPLGLIKSCKNVRQSVVMHVTVRVSGLK